MGELIHWFAHLFGWNTGSFVSKYDTDGELWMAFKCDGCGAVTRRRKRFNQQEQSDG